MQNLPGRRVLAAALLIAASVSLSASAEGSGASPNAGASPPAAVAPYTLVVQMTGLMMLVPENRSRRPLNIFMPPTPHEPHQPLLVFRDNGAAHCDHRADNLCVVLMDGWSLDPIGTTAVGAGLVQVPPGALNVSEGAGGKDLDLDDAKSSARSWFTLRGGLETNSCSLVTWWFRPYGSINSKPIPFINVLEWSIHNLQQAEIVLRRRKIANPADSQELARLRPTGDRVELLVAHLTAKDLRDLFPERLFSQFRPAVPAAPATHAAHALSLRDMTTEMEQHMRAFYYFVGADESRHRMPRSPVETKKVCPVTILELESWRGERPANEARGIKTFGCVVASGEG
jgi:hypothetical protein